MLDNDLVFKHKFPDKNNIFFFVFTANKDERDMCCFALFMLFLVCFVVF